MRTTRQARVREGVKEGGQFTQERRDEDPSVQLTGGRVNLDGQVRHQLGNRVREQVAGRIGQWRGSNWMHANLGFGPKPPAPYLEMQRDAKRFESLSRSRQRELAGEQLDHLLEPGQSFGNDRVKLGPNFTADPDSTLVGLAAQRSMEQAGIPGEVTFSQLEGGVATFEVRDQGLTHEVLLAGNSARFRRQAAYGRVQSEMWQGLGDVGVFKDGPHRFDLFTERPENTGLDYKGHHEEAMLAEILKSSPLGYSGRDFGAVSFKNRTAAFTVDGRGYVLDMKGAAPSVSKSDGQPCTGDESAAALERQAALAGQKDAADLVANLAGAFDETRRRLQR